MDLRGNRRSNDSESSVCLGCGRRETPKKKVPRQPAPNGVLAQALNAGLQPILPWRVDGRAMENVALHPKDYCLNIPTSGLPTIRSEAVGPIGPWSIALNFAGEVRSVVGTATAFIDSLLRVWAKGGESYR